MAKFKTSARTLDLLGRQQIAGIPTAISELFKNAHDAYADFSEIDYLRNKKLFILRDNGLGMTRNDFETRWLTLGTESKVANSNLTLPPIDQNKPLREITGEKGIGRLAIASIGSQVLVLSRAKDINGLHNTVVAFINWKIFELPGLSLDDIVIPLREIKGGILPDYSLINSMKNELLTALSEIAKKEQLLRSSIDSISQEILSFGIIPSEIENSLPNPHLSLQNNGHGTHFYISPTNEMLDTDIDGDSNADATKIEKMLVGFTNTMTPYHSKPQIELAFRDYKGDNKTYKDIINKDYFFTPEDFSTADHHIEGTFDEFGQFQGSITIYKEKKFQNHIINWNGNSFRKTNCGSFSIDFAYVQGKTSQSIISQEDHNRILAKCDKYGGIYIYKDNIRILPYGDSDYDFIDIEKNRTKSASFYFFSYRRMFGAINISKQNNSELREKAGREGFIENKAYRQMREILKNFFIQLAADFFRDNGGGPKSNFWREKRTEQEKIYKALEKREKQAKIKKDLFIKKMNIFFENLSDGSISLKVQKIISDADRELNGIVYIKDSEKASQRILDIEFSTREEIEKYKQAIKLIQPRGFALSKRFSEDYESYLIEFEKLEANVFLKALNNLEELIEHYSSRLHIEISKRRRLEIAVNQVSIDATKITSKKGKEANVAADEVKQRVKELANQLMIGLEDKIRIIKNDFKEIQVNRTEDFDLVKERQRMENEILAEKEKATIILDTILKQLDSIYWEKDDLGNIVTNEDITQALQDKVIDLEDKMINDVELSQLGQAVGIIHHEFSSTVNSIRDSIKDLKAWADVNDRLEGLYTNIRTNFEHLDSYLSMFTPLNRRLQRTKEDISANDIRLYVADLFYPRFERHNIKLRHTKGFTKRSLYGYRSTFYPVFVNIIDNAIHWVKQINTDDDKFIKLHADDSGFYISNNGPVISIVDYNRIFSYGFSRKPKGRGMGLFVSLEALKESGYKLSVISPLEGCNVTFKIEKLENYDKSE